jgi:hypothetical protein
MAIQVAQRMHASELFLGQRSLILIKMPNDKVQISNQIQSSNVKNLWNLSFDIHLAFGF